MSQNLQPPTDQPGPSAPYLLVGAERSGTTLLRLMLDSHPEVSFIEEFEYVTDLVGDDGTFPDPATYAAFLETNRVFATSGFVHRPELAYRDLVDGFLRQRQQAEGASVAGATIHFGFTKALHIWPEAKLIHLLRDPRDVAPSVINMGWASNMWWALDKWVDAEDEWDRLAPTLPAERVLTVRYDELVSDHEAVLGRICAFLGVAYTPRMLDYTRSTDYGPPDPSMATGWRRKLDAGQVRLAEARIGRDRLAAKGFEPSEHPPLSVGPGRERYLKWHNRVGKLRMRVQFHGLGFTVKDLAARALGNERWQRSLRLEAMEVEKRHLKKSWANPSEPLFDPAASPDS
jgi:hypothetical protein